MITLPPKSFKPNLSHPIIEIGRIGAPSGVRGYVKLHAFTQPPLKILDYQPWYIFNQRQSQPQLLKIDDIKIQQPHILIKIEQCNDRNEAAKYTHTTLWVPREQLPHSSIEEYYFCDLEGLNVYHVNGAVMGSVLQIMETGSNDVLVVDDPIRQKEHLIPFLLDTIILKVDLEKGQIIVNWDPDF